MKLPFFPKKEDEEYKKPKGMATIVEMNPVDYFPNEEEDDNPGERPPTD